MTTAYAYAADTQVVDVDDRPSAPVVARTATRRPEDLTVQIFLDDGEWHRKAIGGHETACGQEISYRHAPGLRAESYLDNLCKGGPNGCCFSAYETNVLVPKAIAHAKASMERMEREWAAEREARRTSRPSSSMMVPVAQPVQPVDGEDDPDRDR